MSATLCCRDATALLTEDAEGALTGADKLTFEMHLTVCGPCKRYRAQLEATKAMLKAIPREEPPPDDVDAVLRMLRDAAPDDADDP